MITTEGDVKCSESSIPFNGAVTDRLPVENGIPNGCSFNNHTGLYGSDEVSEAVELSLSVKIENLSNGSPHQPRDRHESTQSEGPELLNAQDSLRKRVPVLEDQDFKSPIDLVPGEALVYQCRNSKDEPIMLTTYRLFIARPKKFINCPLGLIEGADCIDTSVKVKCKDGRELSCSLPSADSCYRLLNKLRQELPPCCSKSLIDSFAMAFAVTVKSDPSYNNWSFENTPKYRIDKEVKRLGFQKSWRLSLINEKRSFCSSYPREHVVPKEYADDSLQRAAKFRVLCRFPSAVWRNKDNGAVLLRSSQPVVGLLCQRSTDDENLMQAIIKACGCSQDMVIVDARSYTAALANRAKGGGLEYPEYYTNCDIKFMSLPNIHTLRGSFSAIRDLLNVNITSANWYSSLDNSKWMLYLSQLLETSNYVAELLSTKPVLVHCSDGWDRTPQIVSLAQLILDPYYRTFKGFQILIEKEWLVFGHKFADRSGHTVSGYDAGEMSPVFLQWLDAVHQILLQCPTAFEFNHLYLLKLMQHVYSCMFGTFLFNNELEREKDTLSPQLISVWSYLSSGLNQFNNKFYTPKSHKKLHISPQISDLQFWKDAYFSPSDDGSVYQSAEDNSSLVRSHSDSDFSACTDLGSVKTARRLSDATLDEVLTSKEATDLNASYTLGEDNPSHALLQSSTSINSLNYCSTSPALAPNSFISDNEKNMHKNLIELMKQNQTEKEFPFMKYIDADGLTIKVDPVQQRMEEIESNLTKKIKALQKQIAELESRPPSLLISPNCRCSDGAILFPEADGNCPLSAGSSSDQSSSSWEELSCDRKTTLWLPDHAAKNCCSCNQPFMLIRRRHHCRQCGLLFCLECANVFTPIPEQNLLDPVRVCNSCYGQLAHTDEADVLESNIQPQTNKPDTNGSAKKASQHNKSNHKTSKAIPIPGSGGKRRAWSETDNINPGSPSVTRCVNGAFTSDLSASQQSLHSNGSSNMIYQTCSQESLNVDNSKDGKRMIGARAEC